MGIPDSPSGIPHSIIDFTMQDTLGNHVKETSTHRPSMLLDAEKGRPIEVEAIVGEVVRMARKGGVDVPVSSYAPLQLFAKRPLMVSHHTAY